MRPELSVRQRMAEQKRGADWFHSLRRELKDELGDAWVLGTYDWTEWFDRKPSASFMRGAENAWMLWQMSDDPGQYARNGPDWRILVGAGAALLGLVVVGNAIAGEKAADDEGEGSLGGPNNARAQGVWGPLRFVPSPLPNNPEAIRIVNGWDRENIVTVPLPQLGKNVEFHRKGAARLVALWAEWERQGLLGLVQTWDGSWVPRFIRGSRETLSNHAFGAAFDINARWNGMGNAPAPLEAQGTVIPLADVAKQMGWKWGGDYPTRPDGMHFELVS